MTMTGENIIEDAEDKIVSGHDNADTIEKLFAGYLTNSGIDHFDFASESQYSGFHDHGLVFTTPNGNEYHVSINKA